MKHDHSSFWSFFCRLVLVVLFSIFLAAITDPRNCAQSSLFGSSCAFNSQTNGAILILVLLPCALLFWYLLRKSRRAGVPDIRLLAECSAYVTIIALFCSYAWVKKDYVLHTCHLSVAGVQHQGTALYNGINWGRLDDFDACLTRYYGTQYDRYISQAEIERYAR